MMNRKMIRFSFAHKEIWPFFQPRSAQIDTLDLGTVVSLASAHVGRRRVFRVTSAKMGVILGVGEGVFSLVIIGCVFGGVPRFRWRVSNRPFRSTTTRVWSPIPVVRSSVADIPLLQHPLPSQPVLSAASHSWGRVT